MELLAPDSLDCAASPLSYRLVLETGQAGFAFFPPILAAPILVICWKSFVYAIVAFARRFLAQNNHPPPFDPHEDDPPPVSLPS